MHDLPITEVLDEIKDNLTSHNRIVLQAPPGAGKTTMVPLALLNQSWLKNKQIILLEPRRLAARNAAARMASLLNENPGETVGYQIRQDSCYSDKTKILVVTEGILTRKLQADPEQKNTALIIFDEFHERSLDADLSLALCLQAQQILNENLKILVMSATLNTLAISSLLNDAPIIQSEGRSYPVELIYLEKPLDNSGSTYVKAQRLIAKLVSTIHLFLKENKGSCLVFLPGVKEINRLKQQLDNLVNTENICNVIVSPLHGSLSKTQQDQAILAPAKNIRKIVLATNIAETSLTIEGVSCVIDSGLERVLEYQTSSAMNALETRFISIDSATQRSGRAGRLEAGVCYRIWTQSQHKRLLKHSQAEILHSDLSSLMLELANWGVQDVAELQWIDVPPQSSVQQAKDLLNKLNAINEIGLISSHGRHLLKLSSHPRLAHMMLSAVNLNQAYHACLIASLLTEKDIYSARADKSIDIHDRLSILTNFNNSDVKNKYSDNINLNQCRHIVQSANDFYKRLKRCVKVGNSTDIDFELTGVLLAYAYPDRISKQRSADSPRYLLSNGKGAGVPEYLQKNLSKYIVIANLDAKSGQGKSEANIFLAADISEILLDEYFSDLIQVKEVLEWNVSQQRVEAKQIKCIEKLILKEQVINSDNNTAVQACLLQGVRQAGLDCLNWSESALNFKYRVNFVHFHISRFENLKKLFSDFEKVDFSDQGLTDNLENWLAPHLNKENSIKQLQKLNLHKILESQLSWEQLQQLNKLAPEKIKVPSGSSIKIDYADIYQPVLAVRLQEVFGLYETPKLLKGELKLMMHLLSPARKPMQVTQDLNSFWKTTYHEVKKELRGKYKRHYWPDDPFTAVATSKTKKNM